MSTPWTKFRNLCAYYSDCVKYSEKRQEYLFTDQQDVSYLLPALPYNWHMKAEPFEIQTSREQLPARNGLITAETDDEIFIGYPMTSFIAPGSGAHCLCPVMLFPVDVSVLGPGRTSGLKVQIDRQGIDINRDWVEFHVPKAQQAYFMRSCEKLTDEMSSIDVECAFQFISNWFKVSIDPNKMGFSMRHADARHELLNTAALFIGGKTKYTRNLIRELNQIKNEPDETLDKTALAYVFRDPPLPIVKNDGSEKRIPAVFTKQPLNAHQYLAVEEALNSPVAKVTGPPGTGKSHMSVNLIANEIFNGGSVLFTSKNHKAVHAVFDMCQESKPDSDFDLVEFCTVPGNDTAAQWDKMRDRLETVKDLAVARIRRKCSGCGDLPDEVLFPELFRVEEALDCFRDSEKDLNRLEELRTRVACFERLLVKMDELTASIQPADRDSPEFQKLLEERLRAFEAYAVPSWWSRAVRRLAVALKLAKPLPDVEAQLNQLVPGLVKAFSTKGSAARKVRRLLRLLKFKQVVEGWRRQEYEVAKAETDRCDYDAIKSALKDASHTISQGIREAYVDSACRRISNVAVEDLISRIKGAMSETPASPLGFLSGLGDDGKYDHQIALYKEFLKVFPAWAVTLLSLRKASPCLPGLFSLVVIDEASQCEIPPMIPALFRARRVAVVGDPDQFPPVITMKEKRNDALRRKYGIAGYTMNKYSFCENNVFSVVPRNEEQTIKLVEHFRCMDDIAMYFNEEFYGGGLCPCVGDRAKEGYSFYNLKPGMAWIDAPGGDAAEAKEALKYLKSLRDSGFKGSVGVISPLRKVANAMKTLWYENRDSMPAGLTDERINTANGFQGGQCDVIVFLLGLNGDRTQGRDGWYITADENKYIYNVSVSRAKVCFTTFGDRKAALNSGISRIIKLIPEERKPINVRVGPGEGPLQKALEEAGLHPVAQYPIFGRYLDLALVKEKIDIEVDGQSFHLDRNGCTKASDIHRDLILETNGWRVIRVWHHEVMQNIEDCVRKVKAAVAGRLGVSECSH